jgi:hypothetical protein
VSRQQLAAGAKINKTADAIDRTPVTNCQKAVLSAVMISAALRCVHTLAGRVEQLCAVVRDGVRAASQLFQTLSLPLPRLLLLCIHLGSALAGLWARKDQAEGELGGKQRRAWPFKLFLAHPRCPRPTRTSSPAALPP